MRQRLLSLLFFLCALFPAASWGEEQALFDRIQEANKDVTALRINFIQSSKLVLFDTPLEVSGTLTLKKPKSLRWEYVAPEQSGFILHPDGGMQWASSSSNRSIKKSDMSPPLRALATQIILWLNMDKEALKCDFTYQITDESLPTITLQPKKKSMTELIKSIVITLPEMLQGVQSITITEANGSVVTLTFAQPEINPLLPESTFTTP